MYSSSCSAAALIHRSVQSVTFAWTENRSVVEKIGFNLVHTCVRFACVSSFSLINFIDVGCYVLDSLHKCNQICQLPPPACHRVVVCNGRYAGQIVNPLFPPPVPSLCGEAWWVFGLTNLHFKMPLAQRHLGWPTPYPLRQDQLLATATSTHHSLR